MPSAVDVETDCTFQERFWIAVRIGWVVMAIVLLAAILGFTGSGGSFSSQTIQAGASRIEMPAVSRWAAADTMTVTFSSPSNITTVLVPAAFGDVFAIESVNPQPLSVTASSKGDEFVFELKPGTGETSINFSVRASRPVWRRALGPFEVNGQASGTTSLTVLP